MSTKFFTNQDTNTLLNKFKGIFEHNTDIENFDALVGYFRASGYFKVRPFLDNVPHIRILVGIDVDKILAKFLKNELAKSNRFPYKSPTLISIKRFPIVPCLTEDSAMAE